MPTIISMTSFRGLKESSDRLRDKMRSRERGRHLCAWHCSYRQRQPGVSSKIKLPDSKGRAIRSQFDPLYQQGNFHFISHSSALSFSKSIVYAVIASFDCCAGLKTAAIAPPWVRSEAEHFEGQFH